MGFRSFSAQTFLIAWSRQWVETINAFAARGHAPLAGVRLDIIKVMSKHEAVSNGWGDVWVAVSLPPELFLEVERLHLADKGALDLTHAVSSVLSSRLPEDFDPDAPLPVTIASGSLSRSQH